MAGRKEQCIHYWILDNRDVGRCRYCGAVRDFGAMQGICRKELAERHAETARCTSGRRGRKAKKVKGQKATKDVIKYQRCDECHGGYLIVFDCRDGEKRCARCKEEFDRKEGGNERGKGDKRSVKEAEGRAPEKDERASQLLYP